MTNQTILSSRLVRLVSPGLLLAALALGTACGGGSSSSSNTPAAPPFTLGSASLTLPVPPKANVDAAQDYYPAPYVGTVTLTLSRSATFTSPVTLAVAASALPANVKADFAVATIPSGGTTAVLTIQAGYPDPSDTTFTKQLYPALNTYTIPITATSGATTETANLTLNLVAETATFGLAFTDAGATSSLQLTNINLSSSGPTTEYFEAYWNTGTYSSLGPVVVSLENVPQNLGAVISAGGFTLQDSSPHSLTLTPGSKLAPGQYSFNIVASFLGETETLPVVVTYSPAPFALASPNSSTVSVAQGQSLTFPFYLHHDDNYYSPSADSADTAPSYLGTVALQATVANPTASSPQASFDTASLNTFASAPLTISASSATPGTYTVNLVATRNGASTTVAPTLPLTVIVTNPSASPTLWIQNVEWGQGVVTPNLRLVAGKPALLRVQLLADRTGVTAPALTATVKNASGATVGTPLTLAGPATVPPTINAGDLPIGSAPSASTYTAILPATDIQTGMTVTLAGGSLAQTLTPSVDPGYTLNLALVPIYVQGVPPVLPATTTMAQELTAFWPLQGVNLSQRAPYTTATVIPQPPSNPTTTDLSGDGWGELLTEVAALRLVDGASANYYGMFNPGLKPGWTASVVGLSLLGEGVGIGIDTVTAIGTATTQGFQNNDEPLDLATTIMVHEEGHAFNLNHAPAGGAAYPQLDYPYLGAAIGSWGYDPVALKAYDPASNYDIMSYAPDTHWVSDWDYLNALGFMGEHEASPVGLTPDLLSSADQLVVSGWIGPDQQVHLAPLVRVSCAARPPKPGALNLVLRTSSAARTIPFGAAQVPDLPAGYRHFSFTVPAGEELTHADVQVPGAPRTLIAPGFHRTRSLAARATAVGAAAANGTLVIRETAGLLHLQWDALAHPYVNVLHEGSTRTTLALHLKGGSADLSLAGLPAGGRFVVHYSDGLNTVAHTVNR